MKIKINKQTNKFVDSQFHVTFYFNTRYKDSSNDKKYKQFVEVASRDIEKKQVSQWRLRHLLSSRRLVDPLRPVPYSSNE